MGNKLSKISKIKIPSPSSKISNKHIAFDKSYEIHQDGFDPHLASNLKSIGPIKINQERLRYPAKQSILLRIIENRKRNQDIEEISPGRLNVFEIKKILNRWKLNDLSLPSNIDLNTWEILRKHINSPSISKQNPNEFIWK